MSFANDDLLTLVLSRFLPGWYLQGTARYPLLRMLTEARFILTMDAEHLASNMRNVPKSTALRMVAFGSSHLRSEIAGSLVNGINIPPYRRNGDLDLSSNEADLDIDILHSYQEILVTDVPDLHSPQNRLVVCSKHTRPGYVRVVQTIPADNIGRLQFDDVLVPVDGQAYLSSEMMKKKLSTIKAFEDEGGPALKGHDLGVDIDFVLCLRCTFFPTEARQWSTRQRLVEWPPDDVIQKVVSLPCSLVACGHKLSTARHLEWRISLAEHEQILIAALTDRQRQCYVTYKTLVKYVIRPNTCLSSYCLLNVMFWCLERTPPGVWNGGLFPTRCFRLLLDLLIHYLVNHELPQYFIPANNLIEHVPRDHIRHVLRSLCQLRTDTASIVSQFAERFSFRYMFNQDGALADFYHNLPEHVTDVNDVIHSYLRLCLRCNQVEGAVSTIQELYRLEMQAECREESDSRQVESISELLQSVRSRVLGDCPGRVCGDTLACLGAVHTYFYLTETDGARREEIKGAARELFEEAAGRSMSAACAVYHGAFLAKTERHRLALKVLEPATRAHDDWSVFGFFRLLGRSYCQVLHDVITEAVYLDMPARQVALYLSVKCCVLLKSERRMRALIEAFRESCWPSEVGCLWLGYTYGRLLDDYTSALVCFDRAADFKASDFMANCRKHCYHHMVEIWRRHRLGLDADDSPWNQIGIEGLAKDRTGNPMTKKGFRSEAVLSAHSSF